MRTRSRHRATARSRLDDTSQKPPSAASESVISTMALTATRPARRRSRNASPIRNPATTSALVLRDVTAVERHRAAAKRCSQASLVRGQHDRGSARSDILERLEDLGGHRLVEISGGLVGEEERRPPHDGPSQRRALRLALRELRGVGLSPRRQPDDAERVEDALGDLAPGCAEHAQDEGDVLVDGADGQQLGVLEDDADRAAERRHLRAPQGHQIVAKNLDVALGEQVISVEEAEQRGLAGPARACQDHELALGDPERHLAQRRDLHGPDRVHLRHPVNLNHDGRFDYSRGLQVCESLSSRRRFTSAGLALPRVAFMTCPTSAPLASFLPRRKSSIAFGLAAITESITWTSAPSSASCVSPSRSTIVRASSPETNIFWNTSLAILPLMVAFSMSWSRPTRWRGGIGEVLIARSSSPGRTRRSSDMIQLERVFGRSRRAPGAGPHSRSAAS